MLGTLGCLILLIVFSTFWFQVDLWVSALLPVFSGFPFHIVLWVLWGILAGFAGTMLVFQWRKKMHHNPPRPSTPILLFTGFLFLLLIGIFSGIVIYAQYEGIVARALRYSFAPFYFLCATIAVLPLFSLSGGMIQIVYSAFGGNGKGRPLNMKKRMVILGYLALLGVTITIPLIATPPLTRPGINELPPKPAIVAHRGGCHYAPENTLAAGYAALELNTTRINLVACEWDIRISVDGVLFLMHDSTLKRTTNVEALFPERKDDPAENFTIAELRQLDAGSWFVEEDPFDLIEAGIVPIARTETYRGIQIPTFAEILDFTRDHGLALDVDLKRPPSDHPFSTNATQILVNACIQSGLGPKIWIGLPGITAEMTHVGSASSPEEFFAKELELINTGSSMSFDLVREFYTNGIPVMVWTIDDPYEFSKFWVAGARYIKTDRLWMVEELDAPLGYIAWSSYLGLWLGWYAIFIVSAGIIAKRQVASRPSNSHDKKGDSNRPQT